ncbi:MAG: acetate uptake transporter [Methanimicrococcus sp.]|nr:acetate uptake transporter [Methanimicrococcus sp.]
MSDVKLADTTGASGALGLTGLGLAALMLSFSGLGLFGDALILVAMSLFVGGFIQVITGYMSWKKGNTFETVAFTAFGFFWVSFAFILVAPLGLVAASPMSTGLYLVLWGILSFCLLLGTLKLKVNALIAIFVLLVTTFFITAIATFTGIAIVGTIAAISTLLLGVVSLYAAVAIVLNELGYKLPL